ncbi:MAG: hypothetical protein WEK74_00065 [Hydrogenophaga sp.]
MTFFAFLGHLLGLFLPALGVSAVLIAVPRLWPKAAKGRWSLKTELLTLLGSGALVLLLGLVIFGRDGKMLTYTALVLVMGTLAWWNHGRSR